MSKKQLLVKVTSLEESLAHFNAVWKKAERGEKQNIPIEIVGFEDARLLMKTLSPRRLDLLQTLHELGKTSIRLLAKKLGRDYSNVYNDVKALHTAGLIIENDTEKYTVPWDKIITEIPMTLMPVNHTPQKKIKKPPYAAHG